ncbi:MAG: YjfB family protein [Rhodocyclaceae bacterium]|jgi:hypothetical protein|nr:YjfB family protein [Rhodocyclaceae bacterium]
MDISRAASAASNASLGSVQGQASLMMLKKAIALQESNALQLVNAIPQAPRIDPAATVGGRINTFA